jgi:hypothetical protein
LTDPKIFNLFAQRHNATYNLMARNEGITGETPIIVEHGKIGMTDPAMCNRNLNLC